jgi:hypothetical protein
MTVESLLGRQMIYFEYALQKCELISDCVPFFCFLIDNS